MPNRPEARSAEAVLTNATGRLPLLRLFSTPLIDPNPGSWRGGPPLNLAHSDAAGCPTHREFCNVWVLPTTTEASINQLGGCWHSPSQKTHSFANGANEWGTRPLRCVGFIRLMKHQSNSMVLETPLIRQKRE